jgi:hypothetical protein
MEPLSLERRRFLAELLGLGISALVPAAFAPSSARAERRTASSLIVLWLEGGPSQLETWDPHPGSPIAGPTRAIASSALGISLAEHYPALAREIHRLSVIRSLVSKEGDHERATRYLKSGWRPDPTVVAPSLGALVASQLAPSSELPPHITLGASRWPAWGGELGAAWDAFRVADPGRHLDNLEASAGPERVERRLTHLEALSRTFGIGREAELPRTLHQSTLERALRLMRSEELAAFKLDGEPAAVLRAYGDHPFGRGCLVARRLVERGVAAVEVTLGGFDSHSANFEAHTERAAILDPAFAALVRELSERDLLQRTVVLAIGEFGRSPAINRLEGRDHWPHAFSAVIGGGGLRAGALIGETDPTGEARAPKDPVAVEALTATVLAALGIDPTAERTSSAGRPIAFAGAAPIGRLLL